MINDEPIKVQLYISVASLLLEETEEHQEDLSNWRRHTAFNVGY
jgi:hypothetical protein